MYLEFREIATNRLYLVNKAFYHNIIEDNELIRRMLMLYLGVINDTHSEEEYQCYITELISKQTGQEEEAKTSLTRTYERPVKELAVLFNKYSRKFSTKQLVCGYRTTGGYEDDIKDIIQTFTHDRYAYCSAELRRVKHTPIGITGIACEENYTDYVIAKRLLSNVIKWADKLGINLSEKRLDLEKSEFNLGEAPLLDLAKEDLDSLNPKLLNYWLRNRLVHQPLYDIVEVNKNGIIELNIALHQIITRNGLFAWNYFKVGKMKFYSCPTVDFAIFVHDSPIKPEHHPMPSLIKKLWERSECDIEKFKENFTNGLHSLLPKICNSSEHLLEFNQEFYHKIFDTKILNDYDLLKSKITDALSPYDRSKTLIPMFNELKSVYDLYRLRLSTN